MQIHLLVEDSMTPIPPNVKVLQAYGKLTIKTNSQRAPIVTGIHTIVEGAAEAIADWLRPHDGVWLGEGPPMLQQFKVAHINS